jgi:hypothetical protein
VISCIVGSNVSIVTNALDLDDDPSLMLKGEATPYNYYKVDMGASPHEAPIPCGCKCSKRNHSVCGQCFKFVPWNVCKITMKK